MFIFAVRRHSPQNRRSTMTAYTSDFLRLPDRRWRYPLIFCAKYQEVFTDAITAGIIFFLSAASFRFGSTNSCRRRGTDSGAEPTAINQRKLARRLDPGFLRILHLRDSRRALTGLPSRQTPRRNGAIFQITNCSRYRLLSRRDFSTASSLPSNALSSTSMQVKPS